MVRNMKKRNSGTQPEPNNNYRTTKNIGIDWMYFTPSFLRNQKLWNQRLHFFIVLSYSPASILQFWQGSYPFKICSRFQRSEVIFWAGDLFSNICWHWKNNLLYFAVQHCFGWCWWAQSPKTVTPASRASKSTKNRTMSTGILNVAMDTPLWPIPFNS